MVKKGVKFMSKSKTKLIIEEDTVYEIDLQCLQRRKQREAQRKKRMQGSRKRNTRSR